MIRRCLLIFSCFCLVTSVSAMDRWDALSMIESGNNDHAIGRCGEISRYQIRRKLWPGGNPCNKQTSLAAAKRIMAARIKEFEKTHYGRAPSDFEFYVLWNAPRQADHPDRVVSERARRFANLVKIDDNRNHLESDIAKVDTKVRTGG
jgi:hypothetical protein